MPGSRCVVTSSRGPGVLASPVPEAAVRREPHPLCHAGVIQIHQAHLLLHTGKFIPEIAIDRWVGVPVDHHLFWRWKSIL